MTSFLEDQPLFDELFEQRTPEIQIFFKFRRERAFEHLTVPFQLFLVMQGKFSLCDDLAIDFRDVLRSLIVILIAAIESNEDDNDESEKENNDPRSLSLAQDIEHERKNLSIKIGYRFNHRKRAH